MNQCLKIATLAAALFLNGCASHSTNDKQDADHNCTEQNGCNRATQTPPSK
jgi:protein involved in sex pheromone biosynthesis